MDLKCPSCGGTHLDEMKLDRYNDVLFRKFVCCDCGCEFVAKYVLDSIVNGSVRTADKAPAMSLPSRTNLGGQMVRHMLQMYEQRN